MPLTGIWKLSVTPALRHGAPSAAAKLVPRRVRLLQLAQAMRGSAGAVRYAKLLGQSTLRHAEGVLSQARPVEPRQTPPYPR